MRVSGFAEARLVDDRRAFARVRADLALDRAATIDAVAAARGSADGSDARGRAELQITRLDGQAARLDNIARDVSDIETDAERPDAGVRALAADVSVERADLAHALAEARAALAR